MSLPNRMQLDDLVAAARGVDWKRTHRRLAVAVERDLAGGHASPDGYPVGSSGGGTPGGAGPAGTSSTERAALASLRAGHGGDEWHRLTRDATRALSDAVSALGRLQGALDRLDSLDGSQAITEAPRCIAHAGAGIDAEAAHFTDLTRRLPARVHLCAVCYAFARRGMELPGNQALIPTPEQIQQHDRTGRWRVRVAPGEPLRADGTPMSAAT